MTLADDIRRAATAAAIRTGPRQRLGVVSAVSPLTVTLGGDTAAVAATTVASYVPVAADTVRVLVSPGAPPLILGPAPDPWHTVGGAGEPAFANTWANTGGSNRKAGFRRTSDGCVALAGWVKSTGAEGANSTIFTLPAGYRPDANVRFDSTAGNSGGTQVVSQMSISTAGLVVMITAATWGNVGLEVIKFALVGPA